MGTDIHRLSDDHELWLAGLHWPGERGLVGHSDGDCAAHAMVDALLAAAGLGDIGSRFGTASPQFAGAAGVTFLHETANAVRAAGFEIANVSVQIIANAPKIGTRRDEAQKVLGDAIWAPVSVSATTTDGLGLTGRGEGIAATAVALLLPS